MMRRTTMMVLVAMVVVLDRMLTKLVEMIMTVIT